MTYLRKLCGPSKTEDLNLSSKILTSHKSCKCKCKFVGRKSNSNQVWNNDECRCECKNEKKICVCKKYYILNPAFCSCENGKYLASITDDSVIMYDEIIEETKLFQHI